MRKILPIFALALAQPAVAAERWHCSAHAQIDNHLSAYLETVLSDPPGGRHADFYISWAQQPGYIAEQQLTWIGIAPDETRLGKPDRFYFGVPGDRVDEEGFLRLNAAGEGGLLLPARPLIRSLRPTFNVTGVTIEAPTARTTLWRADGWTAELVDRQGQSLGRSAILLPSAATVGPVFARLRAELERKVADPAHHCREIPQPTQEEIEYNQILWATPIPRPNLESIEPIPVEDPPPQRIGQDGSSRKSR